MRKKCVWLAHKWRNTNEWAGHEVYERPQHCARCDETRTFVTGVTIDASGRLFYVSLSLGVIVGLSVLLWWIYG
jgi:hypothetical protein